jgi:hypothetical protein
MRTHVLISMSLLVSCTAAFAQSGSDARSTTFQTSRGELVVHTGQPEPRSFGPTPAFAQLDRRGAGYVTSDEADAYPPLANDFIHADANRDGRVSKAEYERWARAH